MNQINVAKENKIILCVDIGLSICQSIFISTFLSSRSSEKPPHFVITHYGDKTGYLYIDTSSLEVPGQEEILNDFLEKVKGGICADISTRISDGLSGELNDEVIIINDKYRFIFKISEYERDKAHNYERVNNILSSSVPEKEKVCRLVTLKISLA